MIDHANGTLRVTVPMVIANARALLDRGRGCLRSGSSTAVLDLAAVAEVDSAAVSLVLAWLRTAEAHGVAVRIANPPASLISLAALYGVSELLPLA